AQALRGLGVACAHLVPQTVRMGDVSGAHGRIVMRAAVLEHLRVRRPSSGPRPDAAPASSGTAAAAANPDKPPPRCTCPLSELVIHSGREPLWPAAAPGRRSRAAAVGDDGIGTVVAVGRESPAAGADVIVRIAVVH